jgi:hypothetical protein
MSLPRISFLEGWERAPTFPRTESDDEDYQDLPEGSVSSSFPSTYSRLNFNPYAGPAWNERPDDHDDRSTLLGLSPTTTREGRASPGPAPAPTEAPAERQPPVQVDVPARKEPWADTTGAYEVSAARRIGMQCFPVGGVCFNANW